jgi:hypothetical protein
MSDSAAQVATAAAIAAAVRIFNTELWTLYAIGVLVTILRTYARVTAVGLKNLRPDDFMVWLAIVRIIGSSKSSESASTANTGQLRSYSTLRRRLWHISPLITAKVSQTMA